jgi:hypothetical protein
VKLHDGPSFIPVVKLQDWLSIVAVAILKDEELISNRVEMLEACISALRDELIA